MPPWWRAACLLSIPPTLTGGREKEGGREGQHVPMPFLVSFWQHRRLLWVREACCTCLLSLSLSLQHLPSMLFFFLEQTFSGKNGTVMSGTGNTCKNRQNSLLSYLSLSHSIFPLTSPSHAIYPLIYFTERREKRKEKT